MVSRASVCKRLYSFFDIPFWYRAPDVSASHVLPRVTQQLYTTVGLCAGTPIYCVLCLRVSSHKRFSPAAIGVSGKINIKKNRRTYLRARVTGSFFFSRVKTPLKFNTRTLSRYGMRYF